MGDGWEGVGQSGKVSWCFEPSQPQRITSRLENSLVIDVVEKEMKHITNNFSNVVEIERYRG